MSQCELGLKFLRHAALASQPQLVDRGDYVEDAQDGYWTLASGATVKAANGAGRRGRRGRRAGRPLNRRARAAGLRTLFNPPRQQPPSDARRDDGSSRSGQRRGGGSGISTS